MCISHGPFTLRVSYGGMTCKVVLTFESVGIPDDLPWGGYVCFLELYSHNKTISASNYHNCFVVESY